MKVKQEWLKTTYTKRLQASLAGTLFLFVVLFLAFPRFYNHRAAIPTYRADNIEIVSIPRTQQKQTPRLPRPVRPVIPVAAEELDVLEEVPIIIQQDSTVAPIMSGAPLDAEDLPYLPRQTLEVMPASCGKDINGKIEVLVLIDKKGRVKDHRVLYNTTNSRQCLKKIIAALKKSRWEVVTLPTGKVEYWIRKTYRIGRSK